MRLLQESPGLSVLHLCVRVMEERREQFFGIVAEIHRSPNAFLLVWEMHCSGMLSGLNRVEAVTRMLIRSPSVQGPFVHFGRFSQASVIPQTLGPEVFWWPEASLLGDHLSGSVYPQTSTSWNSTGGRDSLPAPTVSVAGRHHFDRCGSATPCLPPPAIEVPPYLNTYSTRRKSCKIFPLTPSTFGTMKYSAMGD